MAHVAHCQLTIYHNFVYPGVHEEWHVVCAVFEINGCATRRSQFGHSILGELVECNFLLRHGATDEINSNVDMDNYYLPHHKM